MVTLYGIRNCDKCRAAMRWLTDVDREYRFHDIRTDGLDDSLLGRWQSMVGWEILLNTRSQTWRKLPVRDRRDLNAARALELIVGNPTLMKRPVLDNGTTVIVGFSPRQYLDALERE